MRKKAVLIELLKLSLTALVAGVVTALALKWLYGFHIRWPLVYWLANSAAWGLWDFGVTIQLCNSYNLKHCLYHRFGEEQAENFLIVGSLTVGALCAGFPALFYYQRYDDPLIVVGPTLIVASLGVLVLVLEQGLAIWVLFRAQLLWAQIAEAFEKTRRLSGTAK